MVIKFIASTSQIKRALYKLNVFGYSLTLRGYFIIDKVFSTSKWLANDYIGTDSTGRRTKAPSRDQLLLLLIRLSSTTWQYSCFLPSSIWLYRYFSTLLFTIFPYHTTFSLTTYPNRRLLSSTGSGQLELLCGIHIIKRQTCTRLTLKVKTRRLFIDLDNLFISWALELIAGFIFCFCNVEGHFTYSSSLKESLKVICQ